MVAGVVLGFLSSLVAPHRVFGTGAVQGASIVLSPLITGVVMEVYGSWCESRGIERSYFATLWGGALFALSMAVVRFQLVGMHG